MSVIAQFVAPTLSRIASASNVSSGNDIAHLCGNMPRVSLRQYVQVTLLQAPDTIETQGSIVFNEEGSDGRITYEETFLPLLPERQFTASTKSCRCQLF